MDSFSKQKNDDFNLGATLKSEFDKFTLEQSLLYSKMALKRDSDTNYFLSWWGDDVKNWGAGMYEPAYEGGYGDIEQSQETFAYNVDFLSKQFDFAKNLSHEINSGLDFQHRIAKFKALEDSYMFGYSEMFFASCQAGDHLCSDKGTVPQYFANGNYYKKGSVDVDLNQISLYLDDEIRYKNLTLRPGVRYDWDDYLRKHTISPRFATYYDVFGDENLILSAGANRYYGRSSFAYKLNHEIDKKLEQKMTRADENSPWQLKADDHIQYHRFKSLNMPYNDELALGLAYKISNFTLRLKYINRKNKDQIITRKDSDDKLYYTNGGEGKSDIYTVGIKNLDSYEFFGSENDAELVFDLSKTKRNMENSRYDDRKPDTYVKYNGEIIKAKDRPSDLFNDGWETRIVTHTKIPAWRIIISNFFSLKAPFELDELTDETVIYKGVEIPVIKTKKYSTRFHWDLRLNYKKDVAKNKTFFVNLDILNVTNKKNVAGFNDGSHANINKPVSYDFSENLYEPGRQFWLEVGLDF